MPADRRRDDATTTITPTATADRTGGGASPLTLNRREVLLAGCSTLAMAAVLGCGAAPGATDRVDRGAAVAGRGEPWDDDTYWDDGTGWV